MTITPIDKKRKIIFRRPNGKLVEKDILPGMFLIPQLNIIDDLNKELGEYKKSELEHLNIINKQNNTINELEEKSSSNILIQQIEQKDYELKKYELHCFRENRNIRLTVCSICSNKCKELRNKLMHMNLI